MTFCSSPEVHWAYPCRDHARKKEHVTAVVLEADGSPALKRMEIDAFSSGAWAACEVCHALIGRGDRERLARRSAKRMLKKMSLGRAWSLRDATAHVRRLHDQFWANREGPPVYSDTRPTEDPTR